MSPAEFERAKRDRRLPDLYIGSAEYEIEADDADFRALIQVQSTLPLHVREQLVRREYVLEDTPLGERTDD